MNYLALIIGMVLQMELLYSNNSTLKNHNIISNIDSLKKIGNYYENLQNYDSAFYYYLIGAENSQKNNLWNMYLNCIKNAIFITSVNGKINEGFLLVDTAFAYIKKKKIKTSSIFIDLYNSIGVLYDYMANYDKALQYYFLAIDIGIKIDTLNKLNAIYNNVGTIYYNKGDPYTAIDFFNKSYKNTEDINPEDNGDYYNNIGACYRSIKQYSIAYKNYAAAIECYKKEKELRINLGIGYNNIGEIHGLLGEYGQALLNFQKADTVLKNVLGEENLYCSIIMINTADVLLKKGETQKALEQTLTALENFKKIFGELHPYIGTAYITLAEIYTKMNKINMAANMCQSSLNSLIYNFKEKNIYFNPSVHKLSTTSYEVLLDALTKKATIFEKIYEMKKQ